MDEEKNKSSLTGFGDLIDDVTMTSSPEDENDELEKTGRLKKFKVRDRFWLDGNRQTKIQIWCVKSYHWRNRIPFLVWIQKYKIEFIVRDIVAGLTIGLMLIPQCLAYAELAGLDAYFGLYEGVEILNTENFYEPLWPSLRLTYRDPISRLRSWVFLFIQFLEHQNNVQSDQQQFLQHWWLIS